MVVYGVGMHHGQEFLGIWQVHSDNPPCLLSYTSRRVRAEARALWPVTRQEREAEAWKALVEIDSAYRDEFTDDLKTKRTAARQRHRRIGQKHQGQATSRRGQHQGGIGRADRRAVIAEWEQGDRICGICRQPIGMGEQAEIDHIIPVCVGGTGEQSNLRVTHATCNRHRGGSYFAPGTGIKDARLRYSRVGERCSICHKSAFSGYGVEGLRGPVHWLCIQHDDADGTATLLTEYFQTARTIPDVTLFRVNGFPGRCAVCRDGARAYYQVPGFPKLWVCDAHRGTENLKTILRSRGVPDSELGG